MIANIDLTNQKFGKLTAIRPIKEKGKQVKWECVCDCNNSNTATPTVYALLSGNTKSCGCTRKINLPASVRKHGKTNTPEHWAWKALIRRCSPTAKAEYKHRYFDRGISVCEEWKTSFQSFYNHIGPRPSPQHSVDRIDNNGNYEPGNVRWAIPKTQANNRESTNLLSFAGLTLNISDWAKILKADRHNIRDRLNKGWTVEETLTTPRWKPRGTYPIPETILNYVTDLNRSIETLPRNG